MTPLSLHSAARRCGVPSRQATEKLLGYLVGRVQQLDAQLVERDFEHRVEARRHPDRVDHPIARDELRADDQLVLRRLARRQVVDGYGSWARSSCSIAAR